MIKPKDYDGKLHFRKICRNDLPDLLALKNESWTETHHVSLLNIEDQNSWFDRLDSNPHTPSDIILIAQTKTTIDFNQSVGVFKINNIDWISRSADIGWDVYEKYRRNGYGSEIATLGRWFCFSVINLRRLTAEILEHNIASQKCATKAGFVHEGTKRQAIFKGKYCDSLVYGLVATDLS